MASGERLPHELPPLQEALRGRPGSGPLKPALVETFGPRGYDCRGESGVFTLPAADSRQPRGRPGPGRGHLEPLGDGDYRLQGPGFQASLPIPVGGSPAQYPIGDTRTVGRIVANIAAVVDELDRSFAPEVEAAAGPAPAWFEPAR